MKRMLLGALAVAGATAAAAMAAPPSAMANTTSTIACDKPVAQCVKDLAEWLVLHDPCLTCTIDDEVNDRWEAICETIWARDCSDDDIWPL